MKRYWITGAHGFIGRSMSKMLSLSGHHVAGLGHGIWSAPEICNFGLSYWLNADVNIESLNNLKSEIGKPDGIFHFAGGSSVGIALSDPYQDFNRTVKSTVNLLEWVRLYSPSTHVMAVSSAAVYGMNHTKPIGENDHLEPCSPYGHHKLMMEELCQSYSKSYGLNIVIPRLFSVYGFGLKKQLIWDVCKQLDSKGHVELGGTGAEIRDWTHVNDITFLLQNLINYAEPDISIINVATGSPTTVKEITNMIAKIWSPDDPPKIHFNKSVRQGDPYYLCANVDKLNQHGLTCDLSLRFGITDYVNWFKTYNS